MKKLCTGEDATLGNYRAWINFNHPVDDSPATKYLDYKIMKAPNGENEEVLVEEEQMEYLLEKLLGGMVNDTPENKAFAKKEIDEWNKSGWGLKYNPGAWKCDKCGCESTGLPDIDWEDRANQLLELIDRYDPKCDSLSLFKEDAYKIMDKIYE